MSITEEHIKETLSIAYVTAVVGRAGANLCRYEHDYGLDGAIHPVKIVGKRRRQTGFEVQYQLKASTKWRIDETSSEIVYDLEVKNYNDMVERDDDEPTVVLILLCLPKDTNHWVNVSSEQLVMQNCCYWAKISGDTSNNSATKTIRIPRNNLLDPDAVQQLLEDEDNRRRGHFK